jgi:arginine decarboxylase
VIGEIAALRDRWVEHASSSVREAAERRAHSLMNDLPPLPNFSHFHPAFLAAARARTPAGDMRRAFYQAYDGLACDFVPLDRALLERVERAPELVAASFLTPYPPGFPVLVPGQVITKPIVSFLLALDVKEIHGLDPLGIRVFKESALTPDGVAGRTRSEERGVASGGTP